MKLSRFKAALAWGRAQVPGAGRVRGFFKGVVQGIFNTQSPMRYSAKKLASDKSHLEYTKNKIKIKLRTYADSQLKHNLKYAYSKKVALRVRKAHSSSIQEINNELPYLLERVDTLQELSKAQGVLFAIPLVPDWPAIRKLTRGLGQVIKDRAPPAALGHHTQNRHLDHEHHPSLSMFSTAAAPATFNEALERALPDVAFEFRFQTRRGAPKLNSDQLRGVFIQKINKLKKKYPVISDVNNTTLLKALIDKAKEMTAVWSGHPNTHDDANLRVFIQLGETLLPLTLEQKRENAITSLMQAIVRNAYETSLRTDRIGNYIQYDKEWLALDIKQMRKNHDALSDMSDEEIIVKVIEAAKNARANPSTVKSKHAMALLERFTSQADDLMPRSPTESSRHPIAGNKK